MFSKSFHNLSAFKRPLNYFLDFFPKPTQLLKRRGIPETSSNLTIHNVLHEMKVDQSKLKLSPQILVNEVIPHRPFPLHTLNIPSHLSLLQKQTDDYIYHLLAVMKNELSTKNYEEHLPDEENVSERDHANQAAKIGLMLGLSSELQLVLYTHDQSRLTCLPDYGHEHHTEETHKLIKPLGIFNYTEYHAFAKFLLHELCSPYQMLISQVSKTSLSRQQNHFAAKWENLNKMPADDFVRFCYQIMLLRLIDDSSKVPAHLIIQKSLDDVYLTESEIKSLIHKSLNKRFLELSSELVAEYSLELNEALTLLNRADTVIQMSHQSKLRRIS